MNSEKRVPRCGNDRKRREPSERYAKEVKTAVGFRHLSFFDFVRSPRANMFNLSSDFEFCDIAPYVGQRRCSGLGAVRPPLQICNRWTIHGEDVLHIAADGVYIFGRFDRASFASIESSAAGHGTPPSMFKSQVVQGQNLRPVFSP